MHMRYLRKKINDIFLYRTQNKHTSANAKYSNTPFIGGMALLPSAELDTMIQSEHDTIGVSDNLRQADWLRQR